MHLTIHRVTTGFVTNNAQMPHLMLQSQLFVEINPSVLQRHMKENTSEN